MRMQIGDQTAQAKIQTIFEEARKVFLVRKKGILLMWKLGQQGRRGGRGMAKTAGAITCKLLHKPRA